MDILDNVMWAAFYSPLTDANIIESDFVPNPASFPLPVQTAPGPPPLVNVYNFGIANKFGFCTLDDTGYIDKSIQRHWYDISQGRSYAISATEVVSDFSVSRPYHLIYAYLVENTRLLQIFERVVEKYLQDEELGITEDPQNFSWLMNGERLFFKSDTPRSTNLRSLLRPSSDNSRRNAYFRMFGMDLAFGDIDPQNPSRPYIKAKASNQQFIVLFERFLAEIWQAYINARNTSGANTADVNILVDLAQELREILIARRGSGSDYARMNLSREEFSAVLMTSWFAFAVSYNSPIVNYLNAQSSTIGERLLKIGNKVGIAAHSKCQSLFDMAGAAALVLQGIEAGGIFTDPIWLQGLLNSLQTPPTTVMQAAQRNYMNDLLTVINNWEKATGHRIKNPEANIRGAVRIAPTPAAATSPASQNGSAKPRLSLN